MTLFLGVVPAQPFANGQDLSLPVERVRLRLALEDLASSLALCVHLLPPHHPLFHWVRKTALQFLNLSILAF